VNNFIIIFLSRKKMMI